MNRQNQLNILIQRNEFLKPIVFKSFDTDKELDCYEKQNQMLFDEYYDNVGKINKLKWDLMTPEEQEEQQKLLILLKLKREGNLEF